MWYISYSSRPPSAIGACQIPAYLGGVGLANVPDEKATFHDQQSPDLGSWLQKSFPNLVQGRKICIKEAEIIASAKFVLAEDCFRKLILSEA